MYRFQEPILVTRPYLPDLDAFKRGLGRIWANRWLSNNGPLSREFHKKLAAFLKVPETNLALFSNGTLALEIGFQAMGLGGGDVITTPFTFVATSHALKRIGATPIFADIDPKTLCLSPDAAERLITPRTKGIVPVHVYGHPCDVDGFARLGEKYGVKIIYDAAHAFGVDIDGKSVACYGDMSMFSFHPTKLFHSCEGGLLVFKDERLQEKVCQLRNFAIMSETECIDVGTNAKMNELQALMGIECLEALPELLASRADVHRAYHEAFKDCVDVTFPDPRDFSPSLTPNYAYCPAFFKDFETRERVYSVLKDEGNIYSRRYFYPLLTDFAPYIYGKEATPVARDIAARVLTLPTYYGLTRDDVHKIAENVKEIVRK